MLFLRVYTLTRGHYNGLLALQFLVVFAAILLPTLCMGATFPVASQIYARHAGRVGASVGRIYAANTVGAILGAWCGGYLKSDKRNVFKSSTFLIPNRPRALAVLRLKPNPSILDCNFS